VTSDAAVSLVRATRRFGRIVAMDAVTLELGWGAITCVCGPNGSGKSTLLGMIAGLVLPSSGEVRIGGRGVRSPRAPGAPPRIGYLPQTPVLYDHLTGREHLRLLAQLDAHGDRSQAATDDLLEYLGLARQADDLVRSYSDGMRRKLGLACAAVHGKGIAVLDEPLAGLDEPGIDQALALLVRWRASGTCVLVASHRTHRFEGVVDRTLVLHEGRVIQDRYPEPSRHAHGLPPSDAGADAGEVPCRRGSS
jgi:ABC-type multidrug transport system ATPase subunit